MIAAKIWNHRTLRLSHSRIEKVNLLAPWRPSASASPVRRVAIGAQQQRYVQLGLAVPYPERDFDHRIERVNFLCFVVTHGIDGQTVGARGQIFAFRQQLTTPAVAVRPLRSQ